MSPFGVSLESLGLGGRASSPGFDEETRAFLQGRLRMLTGALTVFTGILLAGFLAANISSSDDGLGSVVFGVLFEFPNALVAMLFGVSGGFYWLLRRRRLSAGLLVLVDGAFLQMLVLPVLGLYAYLHTFEFSGFPIVVPFLSFVILTRAVLIPSTARRTLMLSVPAAIGVLVIQLYHGASYARPGDPYGPGHFIDMLVQNQMLLLSAAGVAAVASRVNLGLRRSSYDAQQLGQYEIHGRIGAGSMGEVYLARHALLKRPTAIKLLRPDIGGEKTLKRFEQEVRQTSRLTHPNTVGIFDYGNTGEGVFYYAMEYLDGADLREIVRLDGPMPAARVIHVLSHACGALAEAHSKGIVHRDIKPANIMLCEQGGEFDVVKILDFGLVKNLKAYVQAAGELEEAGEGGGKRIIGTPETMAPEAIREGGVSRLSDLYSLAVVGYFLLTGGPLFDVDSASEFIRHHQTALPVPPSKRVASVPSDLEAVILRCLAKDPGQRPTSADVLRKQLLSCADAGAWNREDMRVWWKEWFAAHPRSELQEMAVEFRSGSGSFGSSDRRASWSDERGGSDSAFVTRFPEEVLEGSEKKEEEQAYGTRWETRI